MMKDFSEAVYTDELLELENDFLTEEFVSAVFEGNAEDSQQAYQDFVVDYILFCAEQGNSPAAEVTAQAKQVLEPELYQLVYLTHANTEKLVKNSLREKQVVNGRGCSCCS